MRDLLGRRAPPARPPARGTHKPSHTTRGSSASPAPPCLLDSTAALFVGRSGVPLSAQDTPRSRHAASAKPAARACTAARGGNHGRLIGLPGPASAQRVVRAHGGLQFGDQGGRAPIPAVPGGGASVPADPGRVRWLPAGGGRACAAVVLDPSSGCITAHARAVAPTRHGCRRGPDGAHCCLQGTHSHSLHHHGDNRPLLARAAARPGAARRGGRRLCRVRSHRRRHPCASPPLRQPCASPGRTPCQSWSTGGGLLAQASQACLCALHSLPHLPAPPRSGAGAAAAWARAQPEKQPPHPPAGDVHAAGTTTPASAPAPAPAGRPCRCPRAWAWRWRSFLTMQQTCSAACQPEVGRAPAVLSSACHAPCRPPAAGCAAGTGWAAGTCSLLGSTRPGQGRQAGVAASQPVAARADAAACLVAAGPGPLEPGPLQGDTAWRSMPEVDHHHYGGGGSSLWGRWFGRSKADTQVQRSAGEESSAAWGESSGFGGAQPRGTHALRVVYGCSCGTGQPRLPPQPPPAHSLRLLWACRRSQAPRAPSQGVWQQRARSLTPAGRGSAAGVRNPGCWLQWRAHSVGLNDAG